MQTKEEGGFTLVELLLVIVILGILAAIVVAAVGNTSSDAAQNACDAEKKTVESAIQRYIAQNPGTTRGAFSTNSDIASLVGNATDDVLADNPNTGTTGDYTIAVGASAITCTIN